MGHKWNSPRILAITLERLGNCDAICKHLLISFWSPTSWYPNTRGPWANRRNQSLEPRRMFGRWRVILTWLKLVAKSCQSHRIFLEFIKCGENSTPWNVTGSLSTILPMVSWFDVIQQKGIPGLKKSTPNTTTLWRGNIQTFCGAGALAWYDQASTRSWELTFNLHMSTCDHMWSVSLTFRKSIILFRSFLCWALPKGC